MSERARALGLVAAIVVFGLSAVAVGAVLTHTPEGEGPPPEGASELTRYVEQIRQSEIVLKDLFGTYEPCSNKQEAVTVASTTPRAWESSPCWVKVGWKPDSQVRGGYWVETSDDGFTVHGILPKADGTFEHVIATADQPAHTL